MFEVAAAATLAFNLVCSGTLHAKSIAQDTTDPYRIVYIIDLDAKKYCEQDSCVRLNDIADVSPYFIKFNADKNVDIPGRYEFYEGRIDRTSGDQSILHSTNDPSIGPVTMEYKGHCERAPFSGFPHPQTRF